MARHITGNRTADKIVAGYWLVQEGKARKADIDRAVQDELRGKSRAEVEEIMQAVQRSL
ncbi:hypothetical protein ACWGCC_37900 [Streptomyces nigrescens]